MAKAKIISDKNIRDKRDQVKQLTTKWAILVSKEMKVDISKIYSFISCRIKDNGSRIKFIAACDKVKDRIEKEQAKQVA